MKLLSLRVHKNKSAQGLVYQIYHTTEYRALVLDTKVSAVPYN